MIIKRALIGGSGLDHHQSFSAISGFNKDTPYGQTSCDICQGKLVDQEIYFLPRHGKKHHLPPHQINYRANLYALYQLGVKQVISVAAVGGISAVHIKHPLSIPHQIIDYTWGRKHTYFDGKVYPGSHLPTKVKHVDFTHPYNFSLRNELIRAAKIAGIFIVDHGVYGVTQGPRLETRAEIDRLEREGVDIVGMTAMPEAVLARELGMDYACVAMRVNAAAGRGEDEITMENILKNLENTTRLVMTILQYWE